MRRAGVGTSPTSGAERAGAIAKTAFKPEGTAMRAPLASLLVLSLFGIPSAANSADKVTYLECRADNEDKPSLFALDDTTQKVCDRAVQDTWFSPNTFDAKQVSWQDGTSTKSIYRKGKDKRYEHNVLILVHIGRCNHVHAPSAELCKH